jgi:tetratricopeptide (TPR) repeat protein
MRRLFCSILAAILLSMGLPAMLIAGGIHVSGDVSGIWPADDVVNVDAPVFVSPGKTLLIEPGVHVRFKTSAAFQVGGSFLAEGTADDLRRALEYARRARRRFPDNPGIAQQVASFVSELGSVGGLKDPAVELRDAVALVNGAIDANPAYAKYYYTRARLSRLLGDYGPARADLNRAVELEDRRSVDYRDRVAVYLMERGVLDADRSLRDLLAQASGAVAVLDQRVGQVDQSMRESQIRVIESIAFVSAILGLVLTSGNALQQRSTTDALLILAGMAIVLLSSVALGSYVLQRSLRR